MTWNRCTNHGCNALTRYRTGKTCKTCQKRDWYAKNRAHALAYNARYYGWRAPNTTTISTTEGTDHTMIHGSTIRTIHDLIERLEALKADIPERGLSLTEHEQVAWARRSIDGMLDRCRDKTDALGWPESEASEFRSVVGARINGSANDTAEGV